MKFKILVLGLLAFSVFSCETENNGDNYFDYGMEMEYRINQEYISDDQNLKFTITDINDTRCPSDVFCIWQGTALVTIEVSSPQVGIITLSTHDNLIDTVGNYSFELKDIGPYPVSTETIELEDYEVSLKVIKL